MRIFPGDIRDTINLLFIPDTLNSSIQEFFITITENKVEHKIIILHFSVYDLYMFANIVNNSFI